MSFHAVCDDIVDLLYHWPCRNANGAWKQHFLNNSFCVNYQITNLLYRKRVILSLDNISPLIYLSGQYVKFILCFKFVVITWSELNLLYLYQNIFHGNELVLGTRGTVIIVGRKYFWVENLLLAGLVKRGPLEEKTIITSDLCQVLLLIALDTRKETVRRFWSVCNLPDWHACCSFGTRMATEKLGNSNYTGELEMISTRLKWKTGI